MPGAVAGGEVVLDEETVVVVAGSDDRFAMGLTVALTSALRSLAPGRRAHVFVLDGGFSDDSLARCRAALRRARPDAEITVVDNDPSRFAGYNPHGFARAAYLRLMIPEVVPARYRKVLYLDSDVVVDGDIADLWALPDDGSLFRAAIDAGALVLGPDWMRAVLGFADFPEAGPYFNSGVMLIDMPRWRAGAVSERAQDFLAEHSDRCICVDQDALNVIARGAWSVLPPNWNFQVGGVKAWSAAEVAAQPPGITHYLMSKPWAPNAHGPRQPLFDEALRLSGWYGRAEFLRYAARRRGEAANRWLRTTPSLRLVRGARRRLTRGARRMLA